MKNFILSRRRKTRPMLQRLLQQQTVKSVEHPIPEIEVVDAPKHPQKETSSTRSSRKKKPSRRSKKR